MPRFRNEEQEMFGGVGLGTFPLAGPFSPVSQDDAVAILDAYFDAGGIYLDTAPTYAFGGVEDLLGTYLQGRPRESFALSTSCGYVRDGDGYRISGQRSDVWRDAEESLARLNLNYFDIYISHIPDPNTPLEETAAALQELKEAGIARRIGVSNVSAQQLRRYRTAADISVVQNRFSYVNRTATLDLQAELSGVDLVAYQVIERGLLSGAGTTSRREGDLRNRKPEFEPNRVDWLQRNLVAPLAALAEEHETTVESLAVKWVSSQPNVALAQVGATSPKQGALIPSLGRNLNTEIIRSMEEIHDKATAALPDPAPSTIEAFLGLTDYDVRSGSASGS
jgi:methylglyoxal reductase